MAWLEAVVFDLDGTLIDSAPDLLVALNKLLDASSRRRLNLEEVISMIGDGVAKLVERALDATGGIQDRDLAEATAQFLAHYEGHAADHTRPYPGVPEALSSLRQVGIALGICTNKPERATLEVLRSLDLARHFDAVVGGDSLKSIRKPDPRALLATLEKLGATVAHAVMVGDNANDVRAARAAGVPVIVRAGGYTSTSPSSLGADAVITDFSELSAALRALGKAAPPGGRRSGEGSQGADALGEIKIASDGTHLRRES